MKKIYTLLLLLLGALSLPAQIVNIPDANFKDYLLFQYDANNDGQIQTSEALAVTSLSLDYPANLSTELTGISAFSNLTSLNIIQCFGLTSIDLSGLTNLQNLDCGGNQYLTTLNLSGLSQLQTLICSGSPNLTELNLSSQTQLKNLNCFGCYNLMSIDLSNLTQLERLDFGGNYIPNLNLSGLTNLQHLSCNSVYGLSGLNLTGLVNLTDFQCSENNIIQTLDFSQCPQLHTINCSELANLSSVNLSNLNQLTSLTLDEFGNIATLNLSGLAALEQVVCTWTNLNEINLTGANAIKTLDLSNCHLNALNVSNLLQLERLDVHNNYTIPSLNLTGLTNLKHLNCNGNNLNSLSVNHLVNLIDFYCAYNSLTTIDVSALTHLKYFSCAGNQLTTLNVSNLTQLEQLDCGQNNLTTLDITPLVHLIGFGCYRNQLTTIDLSHQTNLANVDCSHNLFTTLDFSNMNPVIEPNSFVAIGFSYNQNLTYVNLKNGIDYWRYGGNILDFVVGCSHLSYVCADEQNISPILSRIESEGVSNVHVNSYCSFTPGSAYNTITGMITFDLTGNGCEPTDFLPPKMKVNINDGTQTGATFTNSSGNYSFFTQAGNYTLTPTLENPYFTVTPASTMINFPSLDQTTQTQNFCISPIGVHHDVEITILPISEFRPGFDVTYQILYKNTGNQIQSGTIDFAFDDAVLDFLNASPTTDSQSLNHLIWNYSNLYPFESRVIDIKFNLNGPTETPPVNIGDVLNYTATLTLNGEGVPPPTQAQLAQTVISSIDPNDKTCLEGSNITPEMVGDYLHYLIRFQNTGTAAAEFVVVKDMLDIQVFDVSSLQITASSHPMTTRITGNKAEFIFENINLPGESVDEPASHGFVAFKIKTKNNLVLGNAVKNKAEIYFDYNFPVITNQTTTTVSLLASKGFDAAQVSIAPNPTQNILNISANCNLQKIELLDIQGRLLESYQTNQRETSIHLSGKASGMYLVKVTSDKGTSVQKVVKK